MNTDDHVVNEDSTQSRDRDMSGPPTVPGSRRWTALGMICMAQFMLMLDFSVINVALPALSADLNLDRVAFTWAVSIYVLFLGGLLLLGGRLADIFGARLMIMVGLAVFTLASLGSGLSQDAYVLIVGRLGQGVGAACLSPAALRALVGMFDGTERNKALGVWSSIGGLGLSVGVLVGGLLTSGPGWRWVFFINLPIGVVLLAAIRILVAAHGPENVSRRVDVLGAATVTAGTGALIYGVVNAGEYGWKDPGTLGAFAAAVLFYGIFAVIERIVRTPLIRLGMLARRPVVAGTFLMFISAGVAGGDLFITSQYLQHLRGDSAMATGLFFLPTALATIVGATAGGRLVGTLGTRPVAFIGLALIAAGNGLLIGVPADGNVYVHVLPGTVLFALGAGTGLVAATTAALAGVAQREAGLVSAIVYTFNPTGSAIFVGVASTVAAVGLGSAPSITGFSHAFLMFTIVGAAGAVISLVLAPSGKPQEVTAADASVSDMS